MLGRLVAADAKMMVRNKQALGWALMFPILFTVAFGLFDFDSLPDADLHVVARNEQAAEPIVQGLRDVGTLGISQGGRTVEEARALLEEGDFDYVLHLRSGGRVTLYFNDAAADRNRIFVPIVSKVLDDLNIALSGAERRYVLEAEGIAGSTSFKYYNFLLPGLVGMAVMSYGIIGLASTIAQYRGQRIMRRILATPLKPRTFLAAIVIAHLGLALVQSAIVLAVGVFAFGASVRGSLLAIGVFVLLGNITFLNIGFMVAARVDTAEAASGMGNAVSLPMMFFSGVFFPTSTLPWILPTVTAFLPLSPLVDAVRDISVNAASITSLGSELLQLAAWAVGSFILASRVFTFERA